jgi:hypothetical protein
MADLFGQVLVPVSPSAPREGAGRSTTSGTFGLRGFLSSASAGLEESLVSRLQRRLDGAGSTLFSMTWKRKAMPSGRPYYQLAVSARRTSGSGFGLWPTPNAAPQNDGDTTWPQRRAELKEKHGNGNGFGLTLGQAVTLASWPTTTREDARSSARHGYMISGNQGTTLLDAARMAAWPTPMAGTPAQKGYNEAGNNDASRRTVELASWVSPSAGDWKDTPGMATSGVNPDGSVRERLDQLPRQAGMTLSGSPAPTEKRGQLNPGFVRWLMGYSTAHLNCAPTETPSSLRSRRSSSDVRKKR